MSDNRFRRGTKRYYIAEMAELGLSWVETFRDLRPKVIAQTLPWVFSANVGGRRVPKSISNQLVDLKNEIRRVYALLGRDASDSTVDTSADEEPKIPEPTPEEPDAIPPAAGKAKKRDEKEFFFEEFERIVKWIDDRAASSGAAPVDSIKGMRPVIAARAAIEEGIPARAMLHSMTLHWSSDTRSAAGIEEVNFQTLSEPMDGGFHSMTDYIVRLARANRRCQGLLPIMLVGPAGTGKSYLAECVAKVLELPFGFTPITAGATPSWLLGRYTTKVDDTGGFVLSKFLEIYANGGVFLFDEIDAGDPNMLLVINNALAADKFYNPVNGEEYEKHADFIPMAAANTFGLGANSTYTGRERIDGATIDRFRMGRVALEMDWTLARSLMFGEK
jgi:hypothetical protein